MAIVMSELVFWIRSLWLFEAMRPFREEAHGNMKMCMSSIQNWEAWSMSSIPCIKTQSMSSYDHYLDSEVVDSDMMNV